eukprot:GDKH01025668.1.p3 GENE.GDKH01025668.1~~GDKH01025668.1.p3  ORF type:complete len:51 (-),score=0.38 GDKH01025668.1:39-191(-)
MVPTCTGATPATPSFTTYSSKTRRGWWGGGRCSRHEGGVGGKGGVTHRIR